MHSHEKKSCMCCDGNLDVFISKIKKNPKKITKLGEKNLDKY